MKGLELSTATDAQFIDFNIDHFREMMGDIGGRQIQLRMQENQRKSYSRSYDTASISSNARTLQRAISTKIISKNKKWFLLVK